jgi:hypothetical protein
VTDSWVDSNGDDVPSDWTPGAPLTPAGEWSGSCGCAAPDGPAIAKDVVITGSPGSVSSVQNGKTLWSLVLNDGTPAADLRIDRFDDTGALVDSPMTIVRATGVVSFNDPVMLAEDPVEPLEAATKQYVDENASGLPEAPMDNYSYARYMATWERLPQSYIPEAPNTSQRFGRFNSTWQLDAIQTDAPSDGGTYGRQNGAWNAALALTGGTITGSLTVNQVLTVQGSNSLVLNAPVTGGSQRAILGMAANITRWQLMLGDGTAEGANNAGANFSLSAYGVAGAFLGNWLTVARADGSTVFNGSGVTIQGGLAVNGLLALASPNNLAIYGGAAGQVLSTNGAGVLSWATSLADAPSDGQYYARHNAAWAVAPGGMTDAPNDGTAYARKSLGWAHLAHTDITDWAATLAGYLPLAGGTLTGPLNLAADPAAPLQSATKQYVDASIARQNRNRLINGDFSVNIWTPGFPVITPINGQYIVDRWHMTTNLTGAVSSQRQAGPVAGPVGVNYTLIMASLAARTIAAGDYCTVRQGIEQTNIGDLQWGTANAAPVTLSFWAKASIAGTYSGSLLNGPVTRAYPFTFALPANVWTPVAVTIPGDTAGTWASANNLTGLAVNFDLGSGATYRAPAGAWAAGNFVGANGAASIITTNGATLSFSAMQLELGAVATPFDWKSYDRQLEAVWRYHQRIAPGVALGAFDPCLVNASGATAFTFPRFNPPMRGAPTVTVGGNISCWTSNGTSTVATFSAASAISAVSATLSWTVTGQPASSAGVIRDNDGTGYIDYNTEIG